jgi:uncharacterized Zn finger protein
MGGWDYGGWPEYVSAAEKKAQAAKKIAQLTREGRVLSPVHIQGRAIATTFWGKAWCTNLEGYGDDENRLPRGRTYARNGSVIDLQLAKGEITALVQGSSLYEVSVRVKPVAPATWKKVTAACAGKIDSMVELLAGRLSNGVMEIICRRGKGLFPEPRELTFECSCPDYASMCKHVAAVFYGVGARLDLAPELLFKLRGADQLDLIRAATVGAGKGPSRKSTNQLKGKLQNIFGIELAEPAAEMATQPRAVKKTKPAVRRTSMMPRAGRTRIP